MSASPAIEIIDLTEIVGEMDTPCDFAEEPSCPQGAAHWAMILLPCARCHAAGARLSCTTCKEVRLSTEAGVHCSCGEVVIPARHAYARVEAL